MRSAMLSLALQLRGKGDKSTQEMRGKAKLEENRELYVVGSRDPEQVLFDNASL